MYKSVGIIAEYNPFHTGHLYQTEVLRSKGYENIAVAMSGSCTQRGEFALFTKFERAKAALAAGVDLVCEIPYPFSSMSAEGFATAGITALKNIGAEAVSFGSECCDEKIIKNIAEYLLSPLCEERLKSNLSAGMPYPQAREKAIIEEFDYDKSILSASNDILAIEYAKACIKLNWNPKFEVIGRQGANYNDKTLNQKYSSASGIRTAVSNYRFDAAERYIPEKTLDIFRKNIDRGSYFLSDDQSYEKAVIFRLRKMTKADFVHLPDCNEEIAGALENAVIKSCSLAQIYENLPTKRYTRARFNRIILAALLNAKDLPISLPYLRILGMGKGKEHLMSQISENSALPVSHSIKILAEKNDECRKTVLLESRATDCQTAFFKIIGEARKDYTEKFIKI